MEELEQAQKQVLAVRHQYEEKVRQLQMRIRATEEERDKVLSNVNSVECETNEKVKKVKDEFEKKLLMLQRDLKKAEQAKRDYSRMQKQSSYHEKQLKTLQHELQEMKKTKVCLCPGFVTRKFCRILLSSSKGSTKYLENVFSLIRRQLVCDIWWSCHEFSFYWKVKCLQYIMIEYVNYKYQHIDCVDTGIYDWMDVIMVCYLVGEVNEASEGRIGER